MNADTALGENKNREHPNQLLLSQPHAATDPRKSARFRVIRGKQLTIPA
jgi:hypothetical protein